ncbi:MAG: trypsin-like peptidase domain-containing protein [Bacteroidota bacterium]
MKIIVTCLVFFISKVVFSQSLPELVSKNEKAVFMIYSYDDFGSLSSTATGFFIDENGKALTNVHVINETKYGFIKTYDGKIFPIERVSRICEECDIAELFIDTKGNKTSFLNLTYTIPPKGSEIFVIGNPLDFSNSVSNGIVSSVRLVGPNKIIQITAPISTGSSGGPIMDMMGNVIGVVREFYEDGQNLNFGFEISCLNNLTTNDKYILRNKKSSDLFIINETCQFENNLILHSIDFNSTHTIVNMSYFNSSLAWGDDHWIIAGLNPEEAFYIEDLNTGQKYYSDSATIGSSPQNPTFIQLGEVKSFKLFFPRIASPSKISIGEGMKGGNWSFPNLNLKLYEIKHTEQLLKDDSYYQLGLSSLRDNRLDDAKLYFIFSEYYGYNKAESNNWLGVIYYLAGDTNSALKYVEKAVSYDRTDANNFHNLYYLYNLLDKKKEALDAISNAIYIVKEQPEFYLERAYLNFELRDFSKAEEDFSTYLNSNRDKVAEHYHYRGRLRFYLNNSQGACADYDQAEKLAETEEHKKAIRKEHKKYCKKH